MKVLEKFLLLFFCTLAKCLASDHAAQSTKPNLIVIMADDLGYGDLSCYGSKVIETPYLDQLAASGVRCTDFHSNGAVCSPTRAALMTGRYQQRSGISGVVTAKSHRHAGLHLSEETMGEMMKKQGYRTGLFGKWHLGYSPKFSPRHQGFDEFVGFVSGNVDYHRHIDQEGHFDWWQGTELKDEPGYLTDLITKRSVKFIEKNQDSPFLLLVQHGAPHYPLQGRKTPGFRLIGKSNREQPRIKVDRKKVYAEMVEAMDEGVGEIVKKLESLELRKNTLIVFCSDNGPAPDGSSGGLRGRKGQLFEGGHRVAGIFNWPGRLPEGKLCESPILTMDFLPTFLALSGGKVEPENKFDGVNIFENLKGVQSNRGPFFWKHKKSAAVRVGPWKLIRSQGGRLPKKMLFNLAVDRNEETDLAAESPGRVKRMDELLAAWEKEMEGVPVLTE